MSVKPFLCLKQMENALTLGTLEKVEPHRNKFTDAQYRNWPQESRSVQPKKKIDLLR